MKKRAFMAGLTVFLCCGALSVLAETEKNMTPDKKMTPTERRHELHKQVVAKIAQVKKADPGGPPHRQSTPAEFVHCKPAWGHARPSVQFVIPASLV